MANWFILCMPVQNCKIYAHLWSGPHTCSIKVMVKSLHPHISWQSLAPMISSALIFLWWMRGTQTTLTKKIGSIMNLFQVGVDLRQGCALSPILFVIYMDRISRHSHGVEGLQVGDLKIASLLFADDVVSKSEAMVLSRKPVDYLLQVGNESLPQVKGFKCLRVLFMSERMMGLEIDQRVRAVGVVLRVLHRIVVTSTELSRKAELLIYRSIFVPTLTYSHELMGVKIISRRLALGFSWVFHQNNDPKHTHQKWNGWSGENWGFGMTFTKSWLETHQEHVDWTEERTLYQNFTNCV